MTIAKFQRIILHWYKTNRRELPWRPPTLKLRRGKETFYKILVSEIMLQQTQIARVIPKYKEFLKAFPTLISLARARDKKLLKVWQGLGYWRRAKYLKGIAKIICAGKNKLFKYWFISQNLADFEDRSFGISLSNDLQKLPGIGSYTARALACFAFGNTEAFLDTNIRRVYLHFFFPNLTKISDAEILPIAQKSLTSVLCHGNKLMITPREWHYALFDYGAMVLKDKKINKQSKHYRKQSKFEGSFRSFRTKVVHFLLAQPKNRMSRMALETFLKKELAKNTKVRPLQAYSPEEIINSLLKDNLIKKSAKQYFI